MNNFCIHIIFIKKYHFIIYQKNQNIFFVRFFCQKITLTSFNYFCQWKNTLNEKQKQYFFCSPVLFAQLLESAYLNSNHRILRSENVRGERLRFGSTCAQQWFCFRADAPGGEGNRCSCGEESASALGHHSSQPGLSWWIWEPHSIPVQWFSHYQ